MRDGGIIVVVVVVVVVVVIIVVVVVVLGLREKSFTIYGSILWVSPFSMEPLMK